MPYFASINVLLIRTFYQNYSSINLILLWQILHKCSRTRFSWHNNFTVSIISRPNYLQLWLWLVTPQSPDLMVSNLFLWKYLKSNVCTNEPQTLQQLKDLRWNKWSICRYVLKIWNISLNEFVFVTLIRVEICLTIYFERNSRSSIKHVYEKYYCVIFNSYSIKVLTFFCKMYLFISSL